MKTEREHKLLTNCNNDPDRKLMAESLEKCDRNKSWLLFCSGFVLCSIGLFFSMMGFIVFGIFLVVVAIFLMMYGMLIPLKKAGLF